MGIALPVTEILSNQVPKRVYQGFYFFLYLGSIFFVCFVYAVHMRTRAVFSIIKSYRKSIGCHGYLCVYCLDNQWVTDYR